MDIVNIVVFGQLDDFCAFLTFLEASPIKTHSIAEHGA